MSQLLLNNLSFLHLKDEGNRPLYGCDQDWFRSFWQRKAGCGPCTLANIMLYLSRAGKLAKGFEVNSIQHMLPLMEAMWERVTPGMMGLNSTERFVLGANQALLESSSALSARALDIEKGTSLAEGAGQILPFVKAGLAEAPVGFLSLLKKQLDALEPWHWVTLVGMSQGAEDVTLHIYDNGLQFDLSLKKWLEAGGNGGFVAFG